MNKFTKDVRQDAEMGRGCYGGNEFQVSYSPIRAGIFSIYLFGAIEDATQFIPAIEVLQAAGENDLVIIHLSTDGGSINATSTFLSAMRDCEARILVKASGGVHSAGTIILLNADEFTLAENTNLLVHNGGCGAGGKYSDFKSEVTFTSRFMETVLRNTYDGFLSDTEIEALIEGKDFWLDADEFAARWEARNDIFRARMEEDQGNALNALLGASEALQKPPKRPRKRKKAPAVTEEA